MHVGLYTLQTQYLNFYPAVPIFLQRLDPDLHLVLEPDSECLKVEEIILDPPKISSRGYVYTVH
jgi:hypothetical protein